MLVAESSAEVAKYIRHFQTVASRTTRGVGGHVVARGWRDIRRQVTTMHARYCANAGWIEQQPYGKA
jgi:hypothetical protein